MIHSTSRTQPKTSRRIITIIEYSHRKVNTYSNFLYNFQQEQFVKLYIIPWLCCFLEFFFPIPRFRMSAKRLCHDSSTSPSVPLQCLQAVPPFHRQQFFLMLSPSPFKNKSHRNPFCVSYFTTAFPSFTGNVSATHTFIIP